MYVSALLAMLAVADATGAVASTGGYADGVHPGRRGPGVDADGGTDQYLPVQYRTCFLSFMKSSSLSYW
ncbi:hypothetical protein GA0070604_5460 [Micromonospora eburnea]|uniref:Uncharacterized protein n=1 Tax=Micromonospora eburnea TaxID=227316 RepID=A0A1C6VGW2_9ACTN|nr:hypothetical protein GA0070604_5460 [Micromonospora eburnea]